MMEGNNKLWEPTEKQFLSPQEKVMLMKQEADEVVREFVKRKPEEIRTEELYEAISRVDSLQEMAEKSGEENLPQYLLKKIEELREHKNLGAKAKMGTMTSFEKVRDPRKRPRIGTHN